MRSVSRLSGLSKRRAHRLSAARHREDSIMNYFHFVLWGRKSALFNRQIARGIEGPGPLTCTELGLIRDPEALQFLEGLFSSLVQSISIILDRVDGIECGLPVSNLGVCACSQ